MEGAVPGTEGAVRVVYWPVGVARIRAQQTPWTIVSATADFTGQLKLHDLQPGTRYGFEVEGRAAGTQVTSFVCEGSFRTAPLPDSPAQVSFTVVTGQDYARRDDRDNGHRIYPVMTRFNPDFFVHTGDSEYYDKAGPWATSVNLARFKWHRLYAMPYQRTFHQHVASYFMKDDHDTLKDDCWPGQTYGDLTWDQGLNVFLEQVPMGDKSYRTVRWGHDLQVWLVEGRDFRSSNRAADGPEKTIWGMEQKQWFFNTVQASDATFRILISPTPLVGPDRAAKGDNHSNRAFAHEGQELRAFIAAQKNMVIVCGDRHWQYVSVDLETGVREYSCGPTSDTHAGGFSESNRSPAHRYLKIAGGFLSVVIQRVEGKPRAVFRHHGVSGEVYNEDILTADN